MYVRSKLKKSMRNNKCVPVGLCALHIPRLHAHMNYLAKLFMSMYLCVSTSTHHRAVRPGCPIKVLADELSVSTHAESNLVPFCPQPGRAAGCAVFLGSVDLLGVVGGRRRPQHRQAVATMLHNVAACDLCQLIFSGILLHGNYIALCDLCTEKVVIDIKLDLPGIS